MTAGVHVAVASFVGLIIDDNPGSGAGYYDERVCLRAYLQNYTFILHQLLCMLPTTAARSSSGGAAVSYVFPVLWTTSRLRVTGDRVRVTSLRRRVQADVRVASCCLAPRLGESIVQGLPATGGGACNAPLSCGLLDAVANEA